MITIKILISAICVSVLTLFLLGAACGVPVDTSDSYYIKFKLDGEPKCFDKGLTDIESNAFANKYLENNTNFFATSDEYANSDDWTNCIEIFLEGVLEGEYSDAGIFYKDEETWDDISTNSLTITKYEDVGGVIEGTFSGTGGGKVITEGVFKVKRIPNDTFTD